MSDIPGDQPGEWGTRQYEIQILTPNLHRAGEHWLPLGHPYDELAKVEYAISDLVRSMTSDIMPAYAVLTWRRTHLRVMEKVTTCVYGKQMALPDAD